MRAKAIEQETRKPLTRIGIKWNLVCPATPRYQLKSPSMSPAASLQKSWSPRSP